RPSPLTFLLLVLNKSIALLKNTTVYMIEVVRPPISKKFKAISVIISTMLTVWCKYIALFIVSPLNKCLNELTYLINRLMSRLRFNFIIKYTYAITTVTYLIIKFENFDIRVFF